MVPKGPDYGYSLYPKSSDIAASGDFPEEKTVGNTNLINPFAGFDDDDDDDEEW
jgi:hypothetical protein